MSAGWGRIETKVRSIRRGHQRQPPTPIEPPFSMAGTFNGVEPVPYHYWPSDGINPYFRTLYSGMSGFGWQPTPLPARAMLREEHLPDEPAVLHLHWMQYLTARPCGEARERTELALAWIDKFLGRGGQLIHSIHEPLAHDYVDYELECEFKREIIKRATVVHLLHESMLDVAASHYDIPEENVLVSAHPMYTATTPDLVERGSARRTLGLSETDRLVLFLGEIKLYKGVERLVSSVTQLRREGCENLRLLIAGNAYREFDGVNVALARAEATSGVRVIDRSVPADHLGVLFRAADIVALPYDQIHTSGVLMLALGFGAPVIAPDYPVVLDATSSGLVRTYDRNDPDDALTNALRSWYSDGVPQPRPATSEFLARHDPVRLGLTFAEAVTNRLAMAR